MFVRLTQQFLVTYICIRNRARSVSLWDCGLRDRDIIDNMGFTFYRLKNKDYNNGIKFAKDNGKRRYFVLLIEETKLFWSRLSIFTGLQCFRVEAAFRNPS